MKTSCKSGQNEHATWANKKYGLFASNERLRIPRWRKAALVCWVVLLVFDDRVQAQNPGPNVPSSSTVSPPGFRSRVSSLIPPNASGPQRVAFGAAATSPEIQPVPASPANSQILRPVYTIPKLPPVGQLLGPGPMIAPAFGAPMNATLPSPPPTGNVNGPIPTAQLISANTLALAEPTAIDAPASLFKAGELICVVGEERILAGDMALYVEPTLEQIRSKVTPAQEEELRARLIRQTLPRYVETKALYQKYLHDVTGRSPLKDQKEARNTVLSRASKIFHEKQVETELKRYKVTDLAALESKLREKNSSLAVLQNQFIEHVLARQLEGEVPQKYDIERDELWKYYQEHLGQWKRPATARWRQLTARFDKNPSRQATEQLINEMFAEVYYGGKRFDVVASQRSQGFTAAAGGIYEWTTQGSLKSTKIDQAIFTYDLAKLSPIIEDEIGLHIVEVLERKPAFTVSFEDAQSEISKQLSEKRREEEIKRMREKVLQRTAIWTRWPEDIPGSKSLQEALGEKLDGTP